MLSTENETKQTFCLSFTDCSMCFLFSSRFRLKSKEVNKKLMSIPDKKAKVKGKSMDGNSIKDYGDEQACGLYTRTDWTGWKGAMAMKQQ